MVTYPSDWRTYPFKKFFTLTAMDEEIEALEIERDTDRGGQTADWL